MMKDVNKAILSLAMAASVLGMGVCEASNLDTYRNLLQRNTYTIKYQEITPQERATNKDRINIYGSWSMNTAMSDVFSMKPTEVTLIADGDSKYEEINLGKTYMMSIGVADAAMCRLQKGDEVFNFTRFNKDGKKTVYKGSKKGVVYAEDLNMEAILNGGQSFGTSNMTRMLNALLPDGNKSLGAPVFRFVGSGWLNNGLNYEDYRSDYDGVFEVVRYYFNGYNLVKIASAKYFTDANGKMNGTRCIIKINEFSATPDKTYLELPTELQDKTKREKNSESAGEEK